MFNATGFVEEKSVPALQIFFRISSKPPSLASDFVVIGSLAPVASPGEGFLFTSFCNFFSAASRTHFCPMLSPKFSKFIGVKSCRAFLVSRSSFLRISTLASVSLVAVHHMSKLKLAIIVGTDKKSLQSCSLHHLGRIA